MGWIRHAFAVEEPGPAQPDDQQKAIVDKMCDGLARRHLTVPATMLCEIGQPLNGVLANLMHFGQPIVGAVFRTDGYASFASFLEKRGSLEYIAQRLEATYEEDGERVEKDDDGKD